MNKQTETALKMAIEALSQDEGWFEPEAAIKACKEALAQPAQEPVAFIDVNWLINYTEHGVNSCYEPTVNPNGKLNIGTKLYTHPAPSQWISVKDRLPEFVDISDFEKSSSDVLILIDEKHLYIGSYIWDSYSQETEFCMRDLDGGYEGVGDMNVTHWMPLPNVPKEQ